MDLETNHKGYTLDGTMDLRGRPVLASKTGKWKACAFLLVYEAFERMAFYGIASNLVVYLTTQLHEDTVSSVRNVNNWSGVVWMTPILGAYLADAYLGRFWTFSISSLIYVLGMLLVTIAVSIKSFKPTCIDGICSKASNLQIVFFYSSLYIIALGAGGTKPNISTFGADQFDDFDLHEKEFKVSFFNWWMFSAFLGALFATLGLVYIQENLGWGLGYGIPTVGLIISLVVFYIGTPFYRHKPRNIKSPASDILKVVLTSFANWKLKDFKENWQLHEDSKLQGTDHSSLFSFFLFGSIGSSNAQLTTGFYSSSCPELLSTVHSVVQSAIKNEARMGASLLRLFFHDCFVNGCDGSILLDDTSSFTGEKNAIPNKNSLRGYEIIDQIKSAVEKVCPGVVSCADVLAVTARDSVVTLGGPTWNVKLGRRDATTASQSSANNNIPPPTSNLSSLISIFQSHGLSSSDLVALSGAHTIGQARCTTFRARIYNESTIDTSFAQTRRSNCPNINGSGDNNLAPLDLQTPTCFDNNYFNNLVNQKGLLHSDQQLFSGGSTNALVQTYANSPKQFNLDFVAAMIKMGDIKPLTGANGEIRKNCRMIN